VCTTVGTNSEAWLEENSRISGVSILIGENNDDFGFNFCGLVEVIFAFTGIAIARWAEATSHITSNFDFGTPWDDDDGDATNEDEENDIAGGVSR